MLKENEVATTIVDVAYHIHRQLGPGLLESVYHAIMKYELEKKVCAFRVEDPFPSSGKRFDWKSALKRI